VVAIGLGQQESDQRGDEDKHKLSAVKKTKKLHLIQETLGGKGGEKS